MAMGRSPQDGSWKASERCRCPKARDNVTLDADPWGQHGFRACEHKQGHPSIMEKDQNNGDKHMLRVGQSPAVLHPCPTLARAPQRPVRHGIPHLEGIHEDHRPLSPPHGMGLWVVGWRRPVRTTALHPHPMEG